MPAPPLGSEPAIVRATARIRPSISAGSGGHSGLLHGQSDAALAGGAAHGEHYGEIPGRHESAGDAGIDLQEPHESRGAPGKQNLSGIVADAQRNGRGRGMGAAAGSPLTEGGQVWPTPVANSVITEPREAAADSEFSVPSSLRATTGPAPLAAVNRPGATSATGHVVRTRVAFWYWISSCTLGCPATL